MTARPAADPAVLVVAADPDVRALCRTVLERDGHRVLVAADTDAACRQLHDLRAGIVLLVEDATVDAGAIVDPLDADGRRDEVAAVVVLPAHSDGTELDRWAGRASEVVVAPLDTALLTRVVQDAFETSRARR